MLVWTLDSYVEIILNSCDCVDLTSIIRKAAIERKHFPDFVSSTRCHPFDDWPRDCAEWVHVDMWFVVCVGGGVIWPIVYSLGQWNCLSVITHHASWTYRKLVYKNRSLCAIFQLYGAASIPVRLWFKGGLNAMFWVWKTAKKLSGTCKWKCRFTLRVLQNYCKCEQSFWKAEKRKDLIQRGRHWAVLFFRAAAFIWVRLLYTTLWYTVHQVISYCQFHRPTMYIVISNGNLVSWLSHSGIVVDVLDTLEVEI